MVVWQITGNEIGPGGNGASHFATKREADMALRDYRKGIEADVDISAGPFKVLIKTRAQLARALDDAMGHGCS